MSQIRDHPHAIYSSCTGSPKVLDHVRQSFTIFQAANRIGTLMKQGCNWKHSTCNPSKQVLCLDLGLVISIGFITHHIQLICVDSHCGFFKSSPENMLWPLSTCQRRKGLDMFGCHCLRIPFLGFVCRETKRKPPLLWVSNLRQDPLPCFQQQ